VGLSCLTAAPIWNTRCIHIYIYIYGGAASTNLMGSPRTVPECLGLGAVGEGIGVDSGDEGGGVGGGDGGRGVHHHGGRGGGADSGADDGGGGQGVTAADNTSGADK